MDDLFGYDRDSPDDDQVLFGEDVEDLWRTLLRGQPPGYSRLPELAERVLRHHHREDRDGAGTTALLLLTHHFWQRCTGQLVGRLERSGLLGSAALDELAETFLADEVVLETSASWFGLAFDVSDQAVAEVAADTGASLEGAREFLKNLPIPHRLHCRPPLRRWAAARLLRAKPDRLGGLCERAALLPAADGGSVLHGLCAAVDVLDDEAACEVLAQALRHPRSTVRKAALQAMVRRGDPAGAHTRGRSDPDATIRAWAAKLAAT